MQFHIIDLFQGITTLLAADPMIIVARLGLMALGILMLYLGKKGILEPLLMIPMGLGMAAVNAGMLFLDPTTAGHIVTGTAANANPVIQQHLGHESIQTTVAVYGHLDRRAMQAAADSIGQILR